MPALFLKNTEELEDSLGYRFKDKVLLTDALTHKSYHHENPHDAPGHNERLEFLGDSVLGLVIAEDLFLKDAMLTEADMSKMKSYLVKEAVLFEIALRLLLGKYLRLGRGEESTGGRQKRSVLSDAVEALLGAVFLDSDYKTARSVITKLFKEEISAALVKKEGCDFKSELQEKSQNLFAVLPEYKIVKQEGEEHKKIFTAEVYINGQLYGSGTGKSKKNAQMSAAKEAFEKIG
ncbi:MAG TPA: ribonuclease III [Nitrospiraceae bacterium]|nr:MAG: ribonuclease III [Nitrospirae bacterium GWA2_46_11]OGW25479.1 MAG: ribonuclease III [Nitrospirae bacterium GWB2_47_37]HAK87598.1 ribonuclease III [Nitrospiraceae bacterium]HCL81793.1 ribonuclease III [Nitrospiraceae bacterium]HCZ12407.1 ribonuclease III [Nitrospiraceae bacterium]